jgi:hypothetical protein
VLRDEDIPTELLPPPLHHDRDVAVELKSNEVRIGPITRARAKLLEQQVNSLLSDTANLHVKNFILTKSLQLCMMSYEGESSVAREEEELHKVLDVKTFHGCTRNETETSTSEEEGLSGTTTALPATLPPVSSGTIADASSTAART